MAGFVPAPQIYKPFCNTGAQVPPPATTSTTVANQEIGYPPLQATPLNAGGIPVDIEQTNGIHNFYSAQILNQVAGVYPTFDSNFSTEYNGYPSGIVLYCESNNSFQKSLINNNTANFITTPSYINDGINWTAVTINDLFSLTLSLYNSAKTFYTRIQANSGIASNDVYTLPIAYPSPTAGILTFSNVQCDVSGNLFFEPAGSILRISNYVTGHSIPATTYTSLTSIDVGPGKWDFTIIFQTTSTNTGEWSAGISLSSTSFSTGFGDGYVTAPSLTVGDITYICVANYRNPLSFTSTINTVYLLVYGPGGVTANGRISATYAGP